MKKKIKMLTFVLKDALGVTKLVTEKTTYTPLFGFQSFQVLVYAAQRLHV